MPTLEQFEHLVKWCDKTNKKRDACNCQVCCKFRAWGAGPCAESAGVQRRDMCSYCLEKKEEEMKRDRNGKFVKTRTCNDGITCRDEDCDDEAEWDNGDDDEEGCEEYEASEIGNTGGQPPQREKVMGRRNTADNFYTVTAVRTPTVKEEEAGIEDKILVEPLTVYARGGPFHAAMIAGAKMAENQEFIKAAKSNIQVTIVRQFANGQCNAN